MKKYIFSILFALLIGYLSVRNLSAVPLDIVSFGDKLAHFSIYAIWSLIILWEHNRSQKPSKKTLWVIILLVAGYGLFWEFVQGNIPHRSFDWADAIANVSGGLATIAAWVSFNKYKHK